MKLTKERARSPLLANANFHPSTGYDSETKELTYALNCYGTWTQGKGYDAEYKAEFSKIEMLRIVQEWMKILLDQERRSPAIPSHQSSTEAK